MCMGCVLAVKLLTVSYIQDCRQGRMRASSHGEGASRSQEEMKERTPFRPFAGPRCWIKECH